MLIYPSWGKHDHDQETERVNKDTMKICTKCTIAKDESLFSFKNRVKGTLQAICKTCHSVLMKHHYSENKEYYNSKSTVRCTKEKIKFFNWLKTQKCCDCNNCNFIVLDYSHFGVRT